MTATTSCTPAAASPTPPMRWATRSRRPPAGLLPRPGAEPILKSTADVIGPGGGSALTGPDGADWLVYHGRAAVGAPRTLRIDPLVWNDAAVPPTLTVRGPTTSPQPL